MARHKVGQFCRLARFRNGTQRIFGNVLLYLGIALELGPDRTQQRLDRGLVTVFLFKKLGRSLEIVLVFHKFGDLDAGLALDKYLHRAIGQLQKLQHIGQHTGFIDALHFRIVLAWIDLAGQEDLLVVRHHLFQCANRLLATNKERHDHERKDNNVSQWQNWIGFA